MAVDTASATGATALLCTWALAAATNESSNSPESSMTGIIDIAVQQCSSSTGACHERLQALSSFAARASPGAAAVTSRCHVHVSDSCVDARVNVVLSSIRKVAMDRRISQVAQLRRQSWAGLGIGEGRYWEQVIDVSGHRRHSHSGRSAGHAPRDGHRGRCFEPHGDQPQCGQSGAVIACMWFGAWIVPASRSEVRLIIMKWSLSSVRR